MTTEGFPSAEEDAMGDEQDDGLDCAGDRYMTSDRDLDALGEALLAWERWTALARWWELGSLDHDASTQAA